MSVPEAILLKIDHALKIKDRKKLKDSIEEIISELRAISRNGKDADVNYLLGYCWYLHPDRQHSEKVKSEVEKSLLSAIRQDTSLAKAWLYLGHNAYDFANFELALERFANVDLNKLPPYLKLKAKEMLVCCKIHLKGLGTCLLDLEKFISLAEQYEPEDLWPKELAKTLTENHDDLSSFENAHLKKLAQRIDAKGKLGNWISGLVKP